MALSVILNGRERLLDSLNDGARLHLVVEELGLKADRVAVEVNGEIARKSNWAEVQVRSGDRLEIVHFVGGG